MTPHRFAAGLRGALLVLPFRNREYVRFRSLRTGETIFEIKMFAGAIVIWGERYRPDECFAELSDDGKTVALFGTLRDSDGPVVKFRGYVEFSAPFSVEFRKLPDDYDGTWRRDET